MVDQVTSINDLTPEQVTQHMEDITWGATLENLVSLLLEDSDSKSLEVANALISMFVQTSYMGVLYTEVQTDMVWLFELGANLREQVTVESEATKIWDDAMDGLEEKAALLRKQLEAAGAQ
jgi:hypothetical protein